jgi:hypothetical protein
MNVIGTELHCDGCTESFSPVLPSSNEGLGIEHGNGMA